LDRNVQEEKVMLMLQSTNNPSDDNHLVGDRLSGDEVFCTLPDDLIPPRSLSSEVRCGVSNQCNTNAGEVSCTPASVIIGSEPTPIVGQSQTKKYPTTTIISRYPTEIQTDIIKNGKPNRLHIEERVSRLLKQHSQCPHLDRQSLHGNLLVQPPAECHNLPFWAFRASGLVPQHLMDHVMESLGDAEKAGCHPHINPLKKAQAKAQKRQRQGLPPIAQGGSRSDYEVPFHIGVFKHPSRIFTQPWVTKDTLQGLKGSTTRRQVQVGKMMTLCKSIDHLVNGRIQRLLRNISPVLLSKYQTFARLRSTTKHIIRHDMEEHTPPAQLKQYTANLWPYLRFGNLGTTVAIGRGQSEKLHLDVHDDEELPTILMVLGDPNNDWDHSTGCGDILLPTLGLAIPLYPGDVFIFFASLLPHQIKLLPEPDRHKRTVATLFTCSRTRSYLQQAADMMEHGPERDLDKDNDTS
jgi:hypothetical protein